MGQGLEVYDQFGRLVFDASTNTTRILAQINIGTSDGSASFPVTTNYFIPWPVRYAGGVPPNITIPAAGTVSWTFGSTPVGQRSACTVLVLGY